MEWDGPERAGTEPDGAEPDGADYDGADSEATSRSVLPWAGPLTDGDLLARWGDALVAAGTASPGEERESAGRELLARWHEPHRHYHDVEHLSEVLLALDLLGTPPGTEQLAAFFHDAVYRGEAGADEEASAALAAATLGALLPGSSTDRVVAAVRSTASHLTDAAEGSPLIDADLSILAADVARYRRYASAVRAEYRRFTDAEFAEGRARVLRGLAERPNLYTTREGRRLWERRARANLGRELALHDPS